MNLQIFFAKFFELFKQLLDCTGGETINSKSGIAQAHPPERLGLIEATSSPQKIKIPIQSMCRILENGREGGFLPSNHLSARDTYSSNVTYN